MSQGPLCPNLSQKVQKKVSQMANRNLSPVILLGGLSVNLNHLTRIKIAGLCYKSTFSNINSITLVQLLVIYLCTSMRCYLKIGYKNYCYPYLIVPAIRQYIIVYCDFCECSQNSLNKYNYATFVKYENSF